MEEINLKIDTPEDISEKIKDSEVAGDIIDRGFEYEDTDYDDGEVRVVFKDKYNPNISITIMYQD